MTRTTEPAASANPTRSDTAELWAAFLRWLLYGIVLAVLPIAVNWVSLMTRGLDASFSAVLGGGELLLVSAVLGATAAGDLMGARTRRFIVFRTVLTGGNLILIVFASLWFADTTAVLRAGTDIDRGFVALGSLVVLVSEIVVCACSFLVTRLEDKR
ncbi:hypothetical protein [Glycomyces sp. NPDC047010]|uniref:hypothetical protein n=1 Tax=Glycomyces sp. NPDC047010 TaxID=3155023 RepID=UPI0033EAD67E